MRTVERQIRPRIRMQWVIEKRRSEDVIGDTFSQGTTVAEHESRRQRTEPRKWQKRTSGSHPGAPVEPRDGRIRLQLSAVFSPRSYAESSVVYRNRRAAARLGTRHRETAEGKRQKRGRATRLTGWSGRVGCEGQERHSGLGDRTCAYAEG